MRAEELQQLDGDEPPHPGRWRVDTSTRREEDWITELLEPPPLPPLPSLLDNGRDFHDMAISHDKSWLDDDLPWLRR